MSAADALRARLTRDGWERTVTAPSGLLGHLERWRKPGVVGAIPVPPNEQTPGHDGIVQAAHEALDNLALNEMPTSLKLAAPDLLDALEAYLARYRCGCGHPACHDCDRDADAVAAISKARGEGA